MRRKYWLAGTAVTHADPTRRTAKAAAVALILILAAVGGVLLGWVISGGLLRLAPSLGVLR